MKVAIVSDLHIGYERFEADAYAQAKEALTAAKAAADMIIIPGDIFDKRAPKPEVIAQAINIFRDLARGSWEARVTNPGSGIAFTDIPVLAVPGTHERTAAGKENPLTLLALAGLLIDISETMAIVSKGDDSVAVFGLGGLSEERVKGKLAELAPKPAPGIFSIFMFHQSVYELLPFSDTFIHYEDLPSGFDLYIDGHIHSRVEAKVHGSPFLIPGSTVLTQLKEGEQERKGFIIYDTKARTYEFVHINSREFVSKRLKFADAGKAEIIGACEREIDSIAGKSSGKPVIRLYLEGTMEHGTNISDLGIRALAAKYAPKAFIDVDYSRLASPELSKNIEELRQNRMGSLSVKELGMRMLAEKLDELKFDRRMDAAAIFELLDNGSAKKEKLLEEAMRMLDGYDAPAVMPD